MSAAKGRRQVGVAPEAAVADLARAERYRRYQQRIRSGRPDPGEAPRAAGFDESGFPLPQPSPRLLKRVARLLNPL